MNYTKKFFGAIFEQQAVLNGSLLCSLISQLGLVTSFLFGDCLTNFSKYRALVQKLSKSAKTSGQRQCLYSH